MNLFNYSNNYNTNRRNKYKMITYSTCYYIVNSKFPIEVYCKWISNFLFIAAEENFNLVIYTDHESFTAIQHLFHNYHHSNVKIIFKNFDNFYMHNYKDELIKNNNLYGELGLNLIYNANWKLKMLWLEKIFFINETIKNKYYATNYYGWCDIGYFRNRKDDTNIMQLKNWSNSLIFYSNNFKQNKIHYGCIQNDNTILLNIKGDINNHYSKSNENKNIPCDKYDENCFSGGFFILKSNLIDKYIEIFENKLKYYLENNYFIKDDQTILMDIIFTNGDLFRIHRESKYPFDNWFMFQRILI